MKNFEKFIKVIQIQKYFVCKNQFFKNLTSENPIFL